MYIVIAKYLIRTSKNLEVKLRLFAPVEARVSSWKKNPISEIAPLANFSFENRSATRQILMWKSIPESGSDLPSLFHFKEQPLGSQEIVAQWSVIHIRTLMREWERDLVTQLKKLRKY